MNSRGIKLKRNIFQPNDAQASKPEKGPTTKQPLTNKPNTKLQQPSNKKTQKITEAERWNVVSFITGGYLSSSLAIATDAAHLLTDFASFMISLISLWISARPPTRKMSFGWYRAEVIGALTSVLMIWVITAILVYMAIERVISKDFEINAVIMLITSAVGVLVNVV
uniref:Cation efflux protein transmembrane domain-containing protein n=1 Tax=Timema genevievae TaxID=629358 RepID=A0A7R9K6D0_TIMGE|nr:unnamed protein product [Timema genevievae]